MENKTTKSAASTARLKVDIANTEKLSDKTHTQLTDDKNLNNLRIKTGNETVKNTSFSENTSDKSVTDSAIKLEPKSDTFIKTQTNINIYFTSTKVDKNEKISIREDGSREMSITFGQQGVQKQTGTGRWKTKIGKLLFQQRKLL